LIISRTPLRISFAGGGSDIPSFYNEYGGSVVSTSINKYVYVSINKSFNEQSTLVRYSEVEKVNNIAKISHPIVREVLRMYETNGVEVTSISDIPSGTGMGSSSSFTVGLINAISSLNK